jgi:hypothetical protein
MVVKLLPNICQQNSFVKAKCLTQQYYYLGSDFHCSFKIILHSIKNLLGVNNIL